jgi:ankyrin repeat protein
MVELLLVHGEKVNHRGSNNIYPLHAATQTRESERIVALLLNYGADVNTGRDIEEGGALQLAVWKNPNIEVVKQLLSKGASVNLESDKYGTALQAARLLLG